MRDPNELDPHDAKELLDMLRVQLISKGVSGRLKVVGGAAIASRYPNDPDVRVTRDIGALYWPKEEVEAVAKEIVLERNLSKDWLNDRARSFAPMSEDRSEINTFIGHASARTGPAIGHSWSPGLVSGLRRYDGNTDDNPALSGAGGESPAVLAQLRIL